MATITKGYTFGATELVTNTKLHALVEDASITNITNSDIDTNANISDTKLAQINSSGKVNGSALTGLANIPSGAGVIPVANIPNNIKKITDTDADTLLDTEESSDSDTIIGKVGNVEILRFHTSGILDLAKQSSCRVYMSAHQSIPNNTTTTVNFDTISHDIQNEFDTGNHKFTATKAGIYLILFHIQWYDTIPAGTNVVGAIKKNETYAINTYIAPDGISPGATIGTILYLSANDYITATVYQASGSAKNLYGGYSYETFLSIHKLS